MTISKKDFCNATIMMMRTKGIILEPTKDGRKLLYKDSQGDGGFEIDMDGAYDEVMGSGDVMEGMQAFAEAIEQHARKIGNGGDMPIEDMADAAAQVIVALKMEGYDMDFAVHKSPISGKDEPCITYTSPKGFTAAISFLPMYQLYKSIGSIGPVIDLARETIKISESGPDGASEDGPEQEAHRNVRCSTMMDRLFVALRPGDYKNPDNVTFPVPEYGLVGEVMVRANDKGEAFPLAKVIFADGGKKIIEAAMRKSEKTMPAAIMGGKEAAIAAARKNGRKPAADDVETGMAAPKDLYVITNESLNYGASAILYDGMLEKIHDAVGGDYFLFAGGIHEWFAIPIKAGIREIGQQALMLSQTAKSIFEESKRRGFELTDKVFAYHGGKLKAVWSA